MCLRFSSTRGEQANALEPTQASRQEGLLGYVWLGWKVSYIRVSLIFARRRQHEIAAIGVDEGDALMQEARNMPRD